MHDRFGLSAEAGACLVLNGGDPPTIAANLDAPRRLGALIAAASAGMPAPLAADFDFSPEDAAQFALGWSLRARPQLRLGARPDDQSAAPDRLIVVCDDPDAAGQAYARLDHAAQGVFWARDLIAQPGNLLGPDDMAQAARSLQPLGVEIDVLDPAEHGLNLLAAVGQGSARPPKLIVLRWNGGAPDDKPLVLVGKGITFDTGGISIKPAEHMEEMKGDMGGAAAVLGAVRAIAGRGARSNVVGILAVAENMPSGRALRPGDVIRSYKGLSVEVADTDAEGRLVLADALAWACARLKPRLLVDAATLTGSVITALGRHHAGLYTPSDSLARKLTDLGRRLEEPMWRLPLSAGYDEDIKSDIADFKNCGWGRVPDAADAARFLQHFVAPATKWAHLDIAGVSECAEDGLYAAKGPVGFAVRLFDALAAG